MSWRRCVVARCSLGSSKKSTRRSGSESKKYEMPRKNDGSGAKTLQLLNKDLKNKANNRRSSANQDVDNKDWESDDPNRKTAGASPADVAGGGGGSSGSDSEALRGRTVQFGDAAAQKRAVKLALT